MGLATKHGKTLSRFADRCAVALGRTLTRGGRALVQQVKAHPHVTIACAAAVTPPIVEAAFGPIAGSVAAVVSDAVIVATAVHAVGTIARRHGADVNLDLLVDVAAHDDLRRDVPAAASMLLEAFLHARGRAELVAAIRPCLVERAKGALAHVAAHPVRSAIVVVPPLNVALRAADAARAAHRAARIVKRAELEAERAFALAA